YLADIKQNVSALLTKVETLRKTGSLSLKNTYILDVFSNNQIKLRTAALPLVERVVIMSIIASNADVVQNRLAADRVHGFQYHPSSRSGTYEWSADLFGLAYPVPKGADGDVYEPMKPVTQTSTPPFFSALGDGLYEALNAAAQWLVHKTGGVRSVAWRDVESFYPSIRRPLLWSTLREYGFSQDGAQFLEEVSQFLGAANEFGISPVDDSWGFLANVYLSPVGRALSHNGRTFQRCADEYFLMAGGAKDRAVAEQFLISELAKLKLTLSPAKRADIELNEGKFVSGAQFSLFANGFWMTILVKGTDQGYTLSPNISIETWHGMLRRVLAVNTANRLHNESRTLVRSVNYARERDVLIPPDTEHGLGERARRYRQALGSPPGLEILLQQRLEESAKAGHTWALHWLLTLLSDIGPKGMVAFDVVARLADASQVDVVLRAQASLTLAKIADFSKAKPVIDGIKPTGLPLADRINMVALYFAEMRWGGNWLQRAQGWGDPSLFSYLAKNKGGKK